MKKVRATKESTGDALLRLARLGEKLQLKAPADLSSRIDDYLGDFLKSFYLFRLWKPVGSKCRTGAISDRAPSGPPPPPSP